MYLGNQFANHNNYFILATYTYPRYVYIVKVNHLTLNSNFFAWITNNA